MNLIDFFMKSNNLLHRTNALDQFIIDQAGLLQKLLKCPVSIVLAENCCAYGHPCSLDVLTERYQVMSLFTWQNNPVYSITDGVIVFWTKSLSNVSMVSACVSQTDIVLHSLVMKLKFEELATIDTLTGLFNRRKWMEIFGQEVETAKRYNQKIGCLILDLDNFKQYNDSFGHPEGDELLKLLGRILCESTRSTDAVGRCGGEEFGVLIKNCSRENLLLCGEKIRSAIEMQLIPPLTKRPVTASIGGSVFPDDGSSLEQLYRVADERMYQAKEGGRNRIVAYYH